MDEKIEIFGKRLKIVRDEDNSANYCEICAAKDIGMRNARHIDILKR